jgi:hypothetical protein
MKRVSLVFISMYAFVMLFGITVGMWSQEGMINCPLMGTDVLCEKNIAEHITMWFQLTAAITTTFVLAGFSFIFFRQWKSVQVIILFSQNPLTRARDNPDIPIFKPLAHAFSQGILHPRLYTPGN